MGMIMGSGAGAIITKLGSTQWVNSWGWRIPFLLGALVGIIGLYIKRSTGDTEVFQKAHASGTVAKDPSKEALKNHWPVMAAAGGMVWISPVSFYVVLVYMTTYLSTETHIPLSTSLAQTGNKLSPGFYLIFVSLVSGALFLGLKETFQKKLHDISLLDGDALNLLT